MNARRFIEISVGTSLVDGNIHVFHLIIITLAAISGPQDMSFGLLLNGSYRADLRQNLT